MAVQPGGSAPRAGRYLLLGCVLPVLALFGLVGVLFWQVAEHAGPQFGSPKPEPGRESLTPAERQAAEPRRAAMEALAKELQGESGLTEERLLDRTRAALAPPSSARIDVRPASGDRPTGIGLGEGRICITATISPGDVDVRAEGRNPDGSCLPQGG
ncbi:hypothetical protein Slala03_74330 [Streptomyces lavendulae subsp. lavendulae]|nr:hypothetical protein Slala03_74330 [Streptomyces lavendulae subsp. lavendulae]